MTPRLLSTLNICIQRSQKLPPINCYYPAIRLYPTVSSSQNQPDEFITKKCERDPFKPVSLTDKTFLRELEPPLKKSFNLASFVNSSVTLQKLLSLGVSLFDIENTNSEAAILITKLDFEKDCLPRINFLVENGLKKENLGRFLSEYPLIFSEDLENLQIRINYLESRGFSRSMITKALNRSSHIISHKTKTTDFKLGQVQVEFNLTNAQLRSIVIAYPAIISLPKEQFIQVKFVLSEEFGFKQQEIVELILAQPKLLEFTRFSLVERLEFIHNCMGLSHTNIVRFPKLITSPLVEIRHRHLYLEKLNRNQYDPTKPLYVPVHTLYMTSDMEFCLKYAKTSLRDYKLFVKSI